MPDFIKKTPSVPRLPGDFSIEADPGHTPDQAESAYLAGVASFLDRLVGDDVADKVAKYPDKLLVARQERRAIAVAALAAAADSFVSQRNVSEDAARLAKVQDDYSSLVPKYGTDAAAHPRFAGDFNVVMASGHTSTGDEQALLQSISAATNEFAADKAKEASGDFSPPVVANRETLRSSAAEELRARTEEFSVGGRSAASTSEEILLARGRYQARRDRLMRRLFRVELKKQDNDAILDIRLLPGLPPPQHMPSSDKEELFVQIHKANTVIRTVCDRLVERSKTRWRKAGEIENQARQLRVEFLEKLYGIAWIGLELEFTALAKLTLAELRNEFFVLEAGRIKNIYVRKLGFWAALTAFSFIAVYIGLYTKTLAWDWGLHHKNFLLAGCGAAIGTWASFSVRQVQFSFDDLVMVEENSLDPPMRILFVIVLTIGACLLFWNNAINLEIGDLKTRAESFRQAGSIALLIGLFCGLSERALATAIAGRASAFVRGVGSAT